MADLYPTLKSIGSERAHQQAFTLIAKAMKKMDVIGIPDLVLTAAQATAGALVGKGSVCRVFGTTSSLVQFGSTAPGVPTTTSQNAVQLSQACQIVIASAAFIQTTNDVTRVEVITLGESAQPVINE